MRASARRTRPFWLAAAGVAQTFGVALLPKCPLCLAMDFGIAGSLLASLSTRFVPLLWPSVALAAVSGAWMLRRARTRRGACCGTASGSPA